MGGRKLLLQRKKERKKRYKWVKEIKSVRTDRKEKNMQWQKRSERTASREVAREGVVGRCDA